MPTTNMPTLIRKIVPAEFQKTTAPRTLRVTISSGAVDRDHDVIDPKGWRLENYKLNPVVLWGHDKTIPAIARTLNIRVIGEDVIAECEFPPEGLHDLADLIYGLASAGFLHSASVGFLPITYLFNAQRDGYDIEEAELLEWSFCNIPSNYEATIQRCLNGTCDRAALDSWVKSVSGSRKAPCSCGNGDVLEIRDDATALEIIEPVTHVELQDFIDIDDTKQLNKAIGSVFAREFSGFLAKEVSESLRDAIDYARGRVR